MKKGKLYDLLLSFANQKSNEPNVLHFLYGYAQLLSMNEAMVRNILSDDEAFEEFKRIEALVEQYNLDVKILKQGLPLVASQYKEKISVASIIEEVKQDDEIPTDLLLKGIVESDEEVLKMFRKGNTLEDVLRFVQAQEAEMPKAPAQETGKMPTQETRRAPVQEEKKTVTESAKKPEQSSDGASFSELSEKCIHLYETLKQFIHGQDDAIRLFVKGYFQSELMADTEKTKDSARAVFLFAGPPGVGKTYLATTAADVLKIPVKRFNMSEYSDHQSASGLNGLPEGYANSPGALTSFVKQNPHSILIFDEVEKAHLNVIYLFLQILDQGALKDNYYKENVSFKDTLIIFTTNVGKKLYEDNRDQNLSLLSKTVILDALAEERSPVTGQLLFPAAICSRFASGNVVMFNHLKCNHLLDIVENNFRKCMKAVREKYHYEIELNKYLPSLFLYHVGGSMDARIISSQSALFLQNELYEFSRQVSSRIDFGKLKTIRFDVRLSKEDKVYDLFVHQETEDIVLVGSEEMEAKLAPLNAKIHRVDNAAEMQKALAQYDNRMVIIDPMHGYRQGYETGVFSMEDYDTEGIHCFNELRPVMQQVPVYILEADRPMRNIDKNTFQQLGARGVIISYGLDDIHFCQQVDEILAMTYLQEKVGQLSKQEKVLNFNTAQKISADGTTATIEFYDFKVQTAVKADSRKMILSDAEKPDVRFADIIGAENAKKELDFFIRYLKNPKEFLLNGVKPPKGILLYGPPGTGKTMLAKAMAGEAEVTFLPVTATDFYKKYVGEGEETIRKVFHAAKKYAPSVIFIDEIDAIAKERTGGMNNHAEPLLNTLLTEMDGFSVDPKNPVFVIAATNFPISKEESGGKAVIDPALLRRFANKILVDLPNEEERKRFMLLRLKKMKITTLSEKVIDNVASRTTGESLANLQNIIDFAVRAAEHQGVDLDDEIFLNAMEEFYYGEKHEWGRDYYESVARHEAGHAYMSFLAGEKPSFLTIVSRGNFGGYMQHENKEKTPSYTRQDLLWRIRTSLAGRASELVFYGEEAGTNTGVSSDLEHATNVALFMLCRYGMSGKALLSVNPDRIWNSKYGEKILEEAEEILQEQMEETIRLIEEGKDKINALVEALLEKNQLMGNEIMDILQ